MLKFTTNTGIFSSILTRTLLTRNLNHTRTFTRTMAVSAPFTRAVVAAVSQLYPDSWADKSFDNTGLLLEAPFHTTRPRQRTSVLLAIDLTRAVADEAIERRDSIIVTYHPIIFRGLKSLTIGNSQQESLLRLASEGISVYSVHTAIDAAPGGNADWLADLITADLKRQHKDSSSEHTLRGKVHFFPPHQALDHEHLAPRAIGHTRHPINPLPSTVHPAPPAGAGMGRVVRFQASQNLTDILARLQAGLDYPRAFPVALPQGTTVEDIKVLSVGICAGSGGSLLSDLPAGRHAAAAVGRRGWVDDVEPGGDETTSRQADLLVTGELSHHETLAAIERGQSVIALAHSNSERAFLSQVMQAQLLRLVKEKWQAMLRNGTEEDLLKGYEGDESVEVAVSQRDRDPYGIWIAP